MRDVLRESRNLFRQNAKAIMLPMAVFQIPLAVVGAIVPWVLYATVYSEQLHPFDAQSLADGPRGLLFALVVIAWVWVMFLALAFNSTILAVRDAREGVHKKLPELLDPSFTHLGGLLILALGSAGLWFAILATSITVLAPLVLLFTALRLALSFHSFALNEARPRAAMFESWTTMRGNVFRLLSLLLGTLPGIALMLLAGSLALIVVSIPFAIIGTSRGPTLAANAVGTIVLGVVLVPVFCYVTTATTVFYLNLSRRNNG
ncbi:MAG: hypothetical protein ABI939_06675 [Anaerolineaceae bacterium]